MSVQDGRREEGARAGAGLCGSPSNQARQEAPAPSHPLTAKPRRRAQHSHPGKVAYLTWTWQRAKEAGTTLGLVGTVEGAENSVLTYWRLHTILSSTKWQKAQLTGERDPECDLCSSPSLLKKDDHLTDASVLGQRPSNLSPHPVRGQCAPVNKDRLVTGFVPWHWVMERGQNTLHVTTATWLRQRPKPCDSRWPVNLAQGVVFQQLPLEAHKGFIMA